jgi:hypothetical protein
VPLKDALYLSTGRTSDPAPITEELVKNITQILASSAPDPDSYDIGAVLTAMVVAHRRLELDVAHHKKVFDQLRGQITALQKHVAGLGG